VTIAQTPSPRTPSPQPLGLDADLDRRRHERGLRAVTRGEVRFGLHDRMLYSTDASLYQVEPLGVVAPASAGEIPGIVAYCSRHGLPMLPRGGGTSLAGQCVNRAVVIDVSAHCADLRSVDAGARQCVVGPGITIDDLNDELAAGGHDLFFAPDPSTSRHCNIGGAIGNNAAGTRSIRYGRTAENLESVDLVLASGETARLGPGAPTTATERRLAAGVVDVCLRHESLIRERFPRTLRRNAGYALDMVLRDIDRARADGSDPVDAVNLAHLVCGAEGTLGVVTGATLTLHPRPRTMGLGVIGFASLEEAIAAVEPCLGLEPSAVELLDDLVIGVARQNNECRRYAELMPQPDRGELRAVLYVEFFLPEDGAFVRGRLEELGALVARVFPGAAYAPLTDAGKIEQALLLRKYGEPLLHALPGSRKPLGFVEDNAVPVERLNEFVREFRAILDRHGTRGAFYAHASVGVLHVRPLLDPHDEGDRRRMESIAVEVADLAKRLGGVMSGEHGDGRSRGPLLERFYGPELMGAFREVKALFDPDGLMNPGNIVDPGSIGTIHESIRVRPLGRDLPADTVSTYFDYEAEGGFRHAVELCNGAGVCRKRGGGVMCPSYMATLDERHATRGRGNALRLAVTGQLDELGGRASPGGEPTWNDPETLATLDLCLSCKACKTECPSSVDVARYKAEYLAQGFRVDGVPLRARVFAHVRTLNRLGSLGAPLSNRVNALPPVRALADRLLGLAPERTLPAFERSLGRRLRGDRSINAGLATDAPVALLFGDCFTAYNEPAIGLDTARVLNAFGYRVELASVGCCGRAAISTGVLDDARAMIERTAGRLSGAVERHGAVGIVVCEPSCLSAITDDWLALKTSVPRERLETLAGLARSPEAFLAERWDDHPRRPEARAGGGPVLVHGHCHAKALDDADAPVELLARVLGADRVEMIESTCCGMAGSFGYTAERYGVSMAIGELSLFPAVRGADAGTGIAAPGTSCRHQIADGTGRRADHPMSVVARALGV
jgi:FAD/FMN-containing dehydrogenase/Fe-S oxidoreductase